ncbi:hypothetical protein Hanom_Chr09g00788131 [Helianthus anomalus]
MGTGTESVPNRTGYIRYWYQLFPFIGTISVFAGKTPVNTDTVPVPILNLCIRYRYRCPLFPFFGTGTFDTERVPCLFLKIIAVFLSTLEKLLSNKYITITI